MRRRDQPRGYGDRQIRFARIEVAVDSSDESRAALTLAVTFAQAVHASLQACELLQRSRQELAFEVESDARE